MGARVRQHLHRARHVEVGHDHRAGARQARGHQRLQPRRVAEHHRVAGRGGLPHAVGIEVERHVGDALALEDACQVLAAAAVAADDHVARGVDRLARDRGHLQRLLQPVAGHQLAHDRVAVHHDEGRGQHRQHHRGQHRVGQPRRQQAALLCQRQQHEAELAGLRQVEAGAQRHARGRAQAAREQRHQAELEQQRHQQQHRHQQPALDHDVPVERHAHGDEEQAQQHVVEGADVGLDLVLVFGLRDQHARDEGAQRQAQARELGEPGQAQRDQQHVEDEQLLAAPPRHEREPPAHHARAAIEQHADQQAGLEQREAQRLGQRLGRRAQRGDQHQQRHHRQVLEQQHAHHALAVLALELEPLGHQLDHDGGAAHGERARERERGLPAQAPVGRQEGGDQQRAHGGDRHRQQHLQQPEPEHVLAHRAQLGQAEFEPDHEHQEHHAEFAQVPDAFGVLRQRQRMRADQHAGRQVAEHRRQLEEAACHHADHRGHQIQEREIERRHGGRC
ncbi:MAG: hypothetical protein GAK39_06079 [Variovorax sp.]|nr:MAG: hypothetical protein GAK39_06079 [Variovorax sp.]